MNFEGLRQPDEPPAGCSRQHARRDSNPQPSVPKTDANRRLRCRTALAIPRLIYLVSPMIPIDKRVLPVAWESLWERTSPVFHTSTEDPTHPSAQQRAPTAASAACCYCVGCPYPPRGFLRM